MILTVHSSQLSGVDEPSNFVKVVVIADPQVTTVLINTNVVVLIAFFMMVTNG